MAQQEDANYLSACHAVLDTIQRQLGFECCLINELSSSSGQITAFRGYFTGLQQGISCAWLNTLCAQTTTEQITTVLDYARFKSILGDSYPAALNSVHTCLGLPIRDEKGTVYGMLWAFDSEREANKQECAYLALAADLLALLYTSEQRVHQHAQQVQHALSAEHDVKRYAARLQARIDELSCQYQLDLLGVMENLSIPDLLQQATEIIPRAWHTPGKVKVQILFGNQTYSSSEFELSTWCQNEPLREDGKQVGAIRVCYDGESPEDSSLFGEESRLLSSMALRLMAIIRRKRTEQALKKEHWRLQSALEGTNVGTWEWNIQTGETTFNNRWAEIIGYTLEELKPISIETWLGLAHPDDLQASEHLLKEHFSGKRPFYDVDCRMKHKDGHWVWVHDRGKVFEWDEEGKPLVMYGTHQDISKRKETEEALREAQARFERLSKHDGLTELLNQRGWEEVLQQEQLRAKRYGHSTGILICDLDGLKKVNDLQGHQAGDLWIKRAAHCIGRSVRDVDLVARIGGDEFAIMALECSQETLEGLLNRLSDALAQEGIGASWGGILAAPGESFAQAIREADKRMYVMKEAHHRQIAHREKQLNR